MANSKIRNHNWCGQNETIYLYNGGCEKKERKIEAHLPQSPLIHQPHPEFQQ